MQSIGKLHKWLFAVAVLTSLFAYSGLADTPFTFQATKTELVVSEIRDNTSCAIYESFANTVPVDDPRVYRTFDFRCFLRVDNTAFNLKFNTQNKSLLRSRNFESDLWLKLISVLKIDYHSYIFIG